MANPALDLLTQLAARLRYKPAHRFVVIPLDTHHARIGLGCTSLPDACGQEEAVSITVYEQVRLVTIQTNADALLVFARLVASYEVHEAAEFFQLDGQSVFLPHRAGAEHGGFNWDDFQRLSGVHLRGLHGWLDSV